MIKNKFLLFGLCIAPIAALVALPNIKISRHITNNSNGSQLAALVENDPETTESINHQVASSSHHAQPGNLVETRLEMQEFGETPAIASSLGRKYYVDIAKGNDSYPGTTETKAFKTIQQANQKVSAGDTVYVKNGTYNENLVIEASGKPNSWITFQAFPGHKPAILASQEAIKVQGSYVKVIGFNISAKAENGLVAVGKEEGISHHVQFLKNIVHDSGCNGIGSNRADYLLIEGNITYRNAFTAPWQCSGISIYHAINFDDKPGFHNVIRGNTSYSNENKVPQSGGQEVTDGNGIIVDDFRFTQKGKKPQGKYRSATLIENNVVFDNGGRGIHVFQSDKVVVRNNTAFHNLKSPNLLGGNQNGEINSSYSDGSAFYNNIAYPQNKSKTAFTDNYSTGNKWDYNLFYNTGAINVGKDNSNAVFGKNNLLNVNPLFINPSTIAGKANFRLKAKSPAMNAGTSINAARIDIEGHKRPLGAKYDLGAYEMKF
jgi:parallel beta-helix repeat protein